MTENPGRSREAGLPLFADCADPPILGGGQAQITYREIMDAFAQYVAEERPRIESPEDADRLMRPILAGKEQEEMHVLLLDCKHGLLAHECVTRGLLDRAQTHAREIFREAIRSSCSRIILVHQHPSGDPTPSAQDIRCTKELAEAGKVIGIEVLDHVVLGERTPSRVRGYTSFREQKLLP